MIIPLSRGFLLILAAVLGLLTATVLGYLILSRPLHLRVAAGPSDGIDASLLTALDHLLDINHASVRLDLVVTPDIHESNLMLQRREVDLAAVRLDDPLPTDAALIALMRTNVVIVAAPARHKLDSFSDLKGKRLGLVARSPLDEPSLLKLLDLLAMKPPDVKLLAVKPDEVGPLTRNGRIDCVVVLGVPADPEVSAVVYAVDGSRKAPPKILAVDIGDFLKENAPAASSETIAKHAFPRRLIPADDVDTIGIPTALAASRRSTGPLRAKVYNNAITELTRNLLERHGELARKIPLASLIAAPDTDKDARFPIHPGAAAYLDDTDVSWYTLLSDQIWNVVLVVGMLSSLITAGAAVLKKQAADPMRQVLERLKGITEQATTADGDADRLSADLSTIAVDIATLAYERGASYKEFAPVQLAFENARNAVDALRTKRHDSAIALPAATTARSVTR